MAPADSFSQSRQSLVTRLRHKGVQNRDVLDAIAKVPRHRFVDEDHTALAYKDTPLPIGQEQTISQPFIVARMTELLLAGEVRKPARMLEIGTGSGYQAAVLAQLVSSVYTIERLTVLVRRARERFSALGYTNIHVKHADGQWGWPEHAPYHGVLVTAAPAVVPEALKEQLAVGARLVIPVGNAGRQRLQVITRQRVGFAVEQLDMVSFVPLVHGSF